MNTSLVRTFTTDNLALEGLLYEPTSPSSKVVLLIHGIAGNFYRNPFTDVMAEKFTTSGMAFLTVNTRGHDPVANIISSDGKSDIRVGSAFEVFEDSIFDIKAWIDFLEAKKYKEVVIVAHSL